MEDLPAIVEASFTGIIYKASCGGTGTFDDQFIQESNVLMGLEQDGEDLEPVPVPFSQEMIILAERLIKLLTTDRKQFMVEIHALSGPLATEMLRLVNFLDIPALLKEINTLICKKIEEISKKGMRDAFEHGAEFMKRFGNGIDSLFDIIHATARNPPLKAANTAEVAEYIRQTGLSEDIRTNMQTLDMRILFLLTGFETYEQIPEDLIRLFAESSAFRYISLTLTLKLYVKRYILPLLKDQPQVLLENLKVQLDRIVTNVHAANDSNQGPLVVPRYVQSIRNVRCDLTGEMLLPKNKKGVEIADPSCLTLKKMLEILKSSLNLICNLENHKGKFKGVLDVSGEIRDTYRSAERYMRYTEESIVGFVIRAMLLRSVHVYLSAKATDHPNMSRLVALAAARANDDPLLLVIGKKRAREI